MYSYMYSVTVDLKLHCLCNTFIVRRIVQAKSIVHTNTFRFEKVKRNLLRQVPFVIEIVSFNSIRYLEKSLQVKVLMNFFKCPQIVKLHLAKKL